MKFGGNFGDSFGGEPFGLDPSYVVDRLVAALEARFKKIDNVGLVQTVNVGTGDVKQDIERMSYGGLPGLLVAYTGSRYVELITDESIFDCVSTYQVTCIATDYHSRKDRLQGYHGAHTPGVWNMTRWAAFYAGRELHRIGAISSPKIVSETFGQYEESTFVGVVQFEATSYFDVREDAISARLESVAFVHNPRDASDLVNDDGSPNTWDPTSPNPAVINIVG